MAIEILMPGLTPTMEEGNLSRWLVKPGDQVVPGQVIAEIETDKSVLEFEALDAGVVAELRVADGTEDVKVGTVLAVLAAPGEAVPSASPPARVPEVNPAGTAITRAAVPEVTGTSAGAGGRVRASPAARRRAAEHGFDLSTVPGTGPGGRVILRDLPARGASNRPTVAAQSHVSAARPAQRTRMSNALRTMARRMTESKATVPHLYCSIDVHVGRLLQMRADLNSARRCAKLSVNDFIVRAVGLALRDCPRMNVQYDDGHVLRFATADVSVAVALEEGLVTPIVRSADRKSVVEIGTEIRALVDKARAGRLRPEEYDGGTFTVSNVGMFGIRQSWPIINLPQAGIVGIGTIVEQPAVLNGELGVASVMQVTLSADHRVVDGAIAGEFLGRLKDILEHPAMLIVA